MTMNSALRNMAKTSIYGAGTKATAMSIEYKEYILELNANTFEMWTGDRKYRLTSSRYAQRHDGGALAQTVVRLLKKRSIWAGGENLKGITIVIKYRRDVPEEIVDSIEEALSMEGFKTTEINKPEVGFENRASNRRIKNAGDSGSVYEVTLNPVQWEILIDGEVVGIEDGTSDSFGEALTAFKANAEAEGDSVVFEYADGESTNDNSTMSVGALEARMKEINTGAKNRAGNKQKVSKDPWKNRKSFSLNLNKG